MPPTRAGYERPKSVHDVLGLFRVTTVHDVLDPDNYQFPNDHFNIACERRIGLWIKELYRSRRGFKRPESAVGVSHLLAWCANYLGRGGGDLAKFVA